jgi:hypothetical protein
MSTEPQLTILPAEETPASDNLSRLFRWFELSAAVALLGFAAFYVVP